MRIAIWLGIVLSAVSVGFAQDALESPDLVCAKQQDGVRKFLFNGSSYTNMAALLQVLPKTLKSQRKHRFLVMVVGDSAKPLELLLIIQTVEQLGWSHISLEVVEVLGSGRPPNRVRFSLEQTRDAPSVERTQNDRNRTDL